MNKLKSKIAELENSVQKENQCIELISSSGQRKSVPLNDVIEIHMGMTGADMSSQFHMLKDAKAVIESNPFEICLVKQAKKIPDYQKHRKEREHGQ